MDEKEMKEKLDFVTPAKEAAASLHELYSEYVKAGFNESQALKIIIAMISVRNDSL